MGEPVSQMTLQEVEDLAQASGMHSVGTRPPFLRYVRDLWGRRGFLWTLSSAKSYAKNEGQRFGQLWAVINPVLLIGTYFFIFGFLLGTDRGIDNFIGFLSVGVIVFGVSASTLTGGSRAILNNTGLVRALQFPRAVLPMSSVLTEFVSVIPGVAVLLVVMLVTGEPPAWSWLLLPIALVLQLLMQLGMVLILARVVNASVDLWNLIPVAVRILRYVSGVFFSITAMAANHPALSTVLDTQPFALQLTLYRQALMSEFAVDPMTWLVGLSWALVLPVVGLWVFWVDEAKYGRG